MIKKITVILNLILMVVFSSCTGDLAVPQPFQNNQTATPIPSPTKILTPTPTLTPTDVPATRIKNAEQTFMNGDYDTAAAEFSAVLTASGDPNLRGAAELGLGRIHYAKNEFPIATQAFITVIEYYSHTSSYAPAVFYLAQTYFQLKQYKQSADTYAQYLAIHPSSLDSYISQLMGDDLSAIGDHDGAIKAYQTAISKSLTGETSDLELSIGQELAGKGDHKNAIKQYMAVYNETKNDFTKATANLLMGRSYLALQMPEQAYARFQDSVHNFPTSYDSYSALVALVNDNQTVSNLDRGIVDYNAGKYGLAMDALYQYILSDPKNAGTAHYYRALAAQSMGDYTSAVSEYSALINGFPDNPNWLDGWQNKAYVLWYHLQRFDQAAQTLLDYVSLYPTSNQAPDMLFQVGRIQERNNLLSDAATTWERMIKEYPGAEISSHGLFLAGITQYRLSKFDAALTLFQKYLVLSTLPDDQAGALLWIGKTESKMGNDKDAHAAWARAAQDDPDGYYGARCQELLLNMAPLTLFNQNNFTYNLNDDLPLAEKWLRSTFSIAPETNLSGMGDLASNIHIQMGDAYWDLGLYNKAEAEYDLVRNAITQDPVNNFRLLNHLITRNLYKPSILISRQILDLAGLDDGNIRNAPIYFNHIRFGTYYDDIVESTAKQNGLDPIILFSIIRQESFFDGFAGSSAGAMGLMQLMPATGKEAASNLNYPKDFQDSDLLRPIVNIKLGTSYFAHQRNYYGDNIYEMLAAYNAGPGHETQEWIANSNNDPDLFVEVIRYSETRAYLMNIASFINSYRFLYEKN